MNRAFLQDISMIRLKESKCLLDNKLWDGAYYLSGYSVECALKACIAKNTKQYDFPDKKVVNESHSHELTKLIKLAGLQLKLKDNLNNDPEFNVNWAIIKDWDAIKRYQRNMSNDALDLYNAIACEKHGLLTWLKKNW